MTSAVAWTRTLPVCVLALALSACATARAPRPVPDGHVLLPGSRISLDVPEGFDLDPATGGFQSPDGRSAIFANEVPGSVYSTMRSFSAEEFQKNGMMLHGHERETVDGWPARLYRATQPVTGAELLRLLLVFGDSGTSVILTAITPDPEEVAELADALRSVRWHREGVRSEPATPGS